MLAYQQNPKAFGEAVQSARRAARLTQIELAAELGIARTTLSEIECGYLQAPSAATLMLIEAWLSSHGPTPDGDLGPLLRAARQERQLSFEGIAAQCGVSKSSLQRIEQGASPTAGVRAAVQAWLYGDPRPARRVFSRLPLYGGKGSGPARYFVAYEHTGGPANTIMELPAEPATVGQVRQMEAAIAQETGHRQVCLRGWQPAGQPSS